VGLMKCGGSAPEGSIDLAEVVRRDGVRVVAFDLRDTLVRSPRHLKVARALCRVGVPELLAERADSAAALALRDKFAGLPGVVDWKLVELYEAAVALAREGRVLDAPDFERAFRIICDEYKDRTLALVPDSTLLAACELLSLEQCATAVVTDGPVAREAEIIKAAYPVSASHLSLFTSGLVGVNKFQPEYYAKLAETLATETQRVLVVGNRLDKDIHPARTAGCETCLIGSPPPAEYSGYWAAAISAVMPVMPSTQPLA
jgi:FMN phosphatase YigB (HAD superfamily)